MTAWPTHRRRVSERLARLRWDRRKRGLQRRAQSAKPRDTQRVKSKATPGAAELDPNVWSRL